MYDLDRMPYCDWVIHKKLAGINPQQVYIFTGRGCGKTCRQLDLYQELLESGKSIRFVTRADIPERPIDLEAIKQAANDFNRLSEQQKRYEEIGRYIHNQYQTTHPRKPETV